MEINSVRVRKIIATYALSWKPESFKPTSLNFFPYMHHLQPYQSYFATYRRPSSPYSHCSHNVTPKEENDTSVWSCVSRRLKESKEGGRFLRKPCNLEGLELLALVYIPLSAATATQLGKVGMVGWGGGMHNEKKTQMQKKNTDETHALTDTLLT